eukprot:186238-Pyramimonas_sp.AAC.1
MRAAFVTSDSVLILKSLGFVGRSQVANLAISIDSEDAALSATAIACCIRWTSARKLLCSDSRLRVWSWTWRRSASTAETLATVGAICACNELVIAPCAFSSADERDVLMKSWS